MQRADKFLFALLCFCLLGNASLLAKKPVTFGIKTGINFSNSSYDSENDMYKKMKGGFHVGVDSEYHLMNNLFIQSGLFFTTKGVKLKEEDENYKYAYKESINQCYIQLPVMAAYKWTMDSTTKLFINAGPYIAYGIGGKRKWKFKFDTEEESYDKGSFSEGHLKRFDCGLSTGVGTELGKLTIGVNYELGLIDINQIENSEYKNRNLTISIGYKL